MIYKPTTFALNITNTLAQHRAVVKLIVLLVMLALMATGVLADGTGGPNPCPLC